MSFDFKFLPWLQKVVVCGLISLIILVCLDLAFWSERESELAQLIQQINVIKEKQHSIYLQRIDLAEQEENWRLLEKQYRSLHRQDTHRDKAIVFSQLAQWAKSENIDIEQIDWLSEQVVGTLIEQAFLLKIRGEYPQIQRFFTLIAQAPSSQFVFPSFVVKRSEQGRSQVTLIANGMRYIPLTFPLNKFVSTKKEQ